MDKLAIALRLIEIAPRFFPKTKPPVTDYSVLYESVTPSSIMPGMVIENALDLSVQDIEQKTHQPTISTPDDTPRLVTDQQAISYQEKSIASELILVQRHLREKGKINNVPCDCIEKHGLAIEALSNETIFMNPSRASLYAELAIFGSKLQTKGTPEAVASLKYDEEYEELGVKARQYRKELLGNVEDAKVNN